MGVYIVGMHRSGTSALAALVSKLGNFPMSRLRGAGNPEGHWERSDLRPALELLLADHGSTWMHPPASDDTMSPSRLIEFYLNRTFGELAQSPFLWKDPRLCLTIDYWLTQTQEQPKIVFIHRPATAVAASLAARDGWSLERGIALWKVTNHNALTRLAGREVFVIDHGRLLTEPAGIAAALQTWLGLTRDNTKAEAAAALVRPALSSSPPTASAPSSVESIQHDLRSRGFGPMNVEPPKWTTDPLETERLLGRPRRKELVVRRVRAVRRIAQPALLEIASAN